MLVVVPDDRRRDAQAKRIGGWAALVQRFWLTTQATLHEPALTGPRRQQPDSAARRPRL
ncbi:MAG: hypothetical protein JO250_12155 [Armatimonadetes bacterium]|nr:hypothetical protein [Armatimonadota bacterium]